MTVEMTETEMSAVPTEEHADQMLEPHVERTDEAAPEVEAEAAETFPRAYVEKLRREAAEHRTRAVDRDDLAHRLHVALVTATGRLADPTDLTYDDTHLEDPEALRAAIDGLLDRKPHLASRRPVGDVGQGATGGDNPVDLAGLLRRNAS